MFDHLYVSLGLGVLLVGACGGGERAATDAPLPTTVSRMLGTEGGTIKLEGQATLDIPAGALDAATMISISLSSANVPADAIGAVYRFEPSGLVFALPVTIHLVLPAGASSGRVHWSRPDGQTGFDALPSVVAGGYVDAAISHFSFGYVGPAGASPSPDAGLPDGGGGPLDGGPGADAGPIPDGGPGLDAGPIPDGGPGLDAGLDAGPIPDGPGLDASPLPDGGPGPDAAPIPDAASIPDAGIPIDGGGPTPPRDGGRR